MIVGSPARAQDWGHIQLTVVSPDPVKAGGKVFFQVIVLNTGTHKWDAGSYLTKIEIFNSEKGYMTTTTGYRGAVDVASGETALVYIPFRIPEDYSGTYYYKITLAHEAVRTITSDYYDFIVIPVITPPKPVLPVKIGGNAILSFKDSSKENWQDYLGNMSVNLVGRVYNNPIQFSAYTYHTRENIFDFDRILFSYYGKRTNISAGDIMPAFSSLVLSSKGMRGVEVLNNLNKLKTSFIGAISTEREAGSEDKTGVFSQYLIGGHGELKLPHNFNINVSVVSGFDDINSLNLSAGEWGPGENPTRPVRSNVGGLNVLWKPVSSEDFELDVNGEFAVSDYWSDISGDGSSQDEIDQAWKLGLDLSRNKFSFSGRLQRINPNFISLGSPTASRDRAGFDLTTSYGIHKYISVSGGYNEYSDNLGNDAAKVTTKQSIVFGGINLNFKKLPPISIGYNLNKMSGNPVEALDNYTGSWSLGMACNWDKANLSLGGQISDFRDETDSIHDLNTIMGNMNLNAVLHDNFSVTSGVNLSRRKDLQDTSSDITLALSVGLNYKIVPGKLVLISWGSLNQNSGTTESSMINTNVEMNYSIKGKMTLTLGHNWESLASASDNHDEHGFIFRLSTSF